MAYVLKYTTKERVEYYSGVAVADINDIVMEDSEDWVESCLKSNGIDPTTVDKTDSDLRMAATCRAVWGLGQSGGGKKFKINQTPTSSSSLGEISESFQGMQTTGNELPTSDWYVEAQRYINSFISNEIDNVETSKIRRYTPQSASGTDVVDTYHVTGKEGSTRKRSWL